jgi:hypothetical protein
VRATSRIRFPAPFFARGFLVRGTVVWVVLRLVVFGATRGILAQDPAVADPVAEAVQLSPQALLALVAVVCWLVLIDARRRNNLLFLANMGVGRVVIGVIAVGPVFLADLIVTAVLW